VAERERQRERRGRRVHEMQVGVADAGRRHPQEHLAGTGLRDLGLPELGLARPHELIGTHGQEHARPPAAGTFVRERTEGGAFACVG
jgi:hypothetical protein